MRRFLPSIIVLVSGCFYPADRGRVLEAKVDKLSVDSAQISAQLKDSQDKLAATLPALQKALDNLDKASRRSGADIGVQLQKTVEDLAQLRGQVETYIFKIGELESELKKQNDDFERRLAEFQGKDAVKAAETRRKSEELKRPEDKKQFLQLADDKAKAGDFSLARQLYVEFLKRWSKDELTGEAHFGLGETYWAEEKCREALFEYGKVIQEHSRTKSAPNAYLRSAECFHRLKMGDESRFALEEVMREFPKSEAARTAKIRLAELDREKGQKVTSGAKKGRK